MTDILRINDEVISNEDFVKHLKLNGRFDGLIEELVSEKLTVHAGRRMGIEVTDEEIQARADQMRRVFGLHRAVDMNLWLDKMRVTLADLETFIIDMLFYEKTQAQVVTEDAVHNYYQLNSPKFDAIMLSHIVVDSEGKAREIIALAEEEPEMFGELAREHSQADTRSEGGYIGRVTRGSLVTDVEAKVFNATAGQVLGPFPGPGGGLFEIFLVNDKRNAELDATTETEIRRLIKEEWLVAQAKESSIEAN